MNQFLLVSSCSRDDTYVRENNKEYRKLTLNVNQIKDFKVNQKITFYWLFRDLECKEIATAQPLIVKSLIVYI